MQYLIQPQDRILNCFKKIGSTTKKFRLISWKHYCFNVFFVCNERTIVPIETNKKSRCLCMDKNRKKVVRIQEREKNWWMKKKYYFLQPKTKSHVRLLFKPHKYTHTQTKHHINNIKPIYLWFLIIWCGYCWWDIVGCFFFLAILIFNFFFVEKLD